MHDKRTRNDGQTYDTVVASVGFADVAGVEGLVLVVGVGGLVLVAGVGGVIGRLIGVAAT